MLDNPWPKSRKRSGSIMKAVAQVPFKQAANCLLGG
jgi:hypothetical protein